MNEEAKRRAMLKYFADRRNEPICELQFEPTIPGISETEHERLLNFLEQESCVDEVNITRFYGGAVFVAGKITSRGIEVNDDRLPFKQDTVPSSQTFNINNAHNVAAGNNNTVQQTFNQSVQVLIDQIERSNGSPEEKAEAKSLLRRFLEHPLVVGLAPAAIEAILNGSVTAQP